MSNKRARTRLMAAVLGLLALASWHGPTAAAEPPKVVASILPLHSLAAAVMDGVGEPRLLVEGSGSPHAFSLRPSDARALEEADLVLWVDAELELFMERPLQSLSAGARVLTLSEAPGVQLLEAREGGVWERKPHEEAAHDGDDQGHDHAHDQEHDHGEHDLHIWLSPANARAMTAAIAEALVELDPANAETYQQNAMQTREELTALEQELRARLQGLGEASFIVFHDAYHYFEETFSLQAAGAVTLGPERQPGARRLQEIRETIRVRGARCVFAEPQFEPRLVETIVEGTGARVGTLDPLGAELEPGKAAYATMMTNLADAFLRCIEGQEAD